jgi:hypothetical protein
MGDKGFWPRAAIPIVIGIDRLDFVKSMFYSNSAS